MKNSEKKNLLAIFFLLFALTGTLFYLMIKKDLQDETKRDQSYQVDGRQENIWPKVEIQTR